jgi:2-methylcitrate dehydratase
MPNIIEIKTRDGRLFSKKITYPKGHPKNPVTDKEVEIKFKSLAADVLSPEQVDTVLDKLWHLESINNIGEIMDSIVVRENYE